MNLISEWMSFEIGEVQLLCRTVNRSFVLTLKTRTHIYHIELSYNLEFAALERTATDGSNWQRVDVNSSGDLQHLYFEVNSPTSDVGRWVRTTMISMLREPSELLQGSISDNDKIIQYLSNFPT